MAGIWTVAHPEIPDEIDWWLWSLAIFAWLLLVRAALAFAVISLLRRKRGGMAMGALAPWMMRHRVSGYGALAERVEGTVGAIHAFEAANGRAPQSLDELVPRYLDRVPQLGKVRYLGLRARVRS